MGHSLAMDKQFLNQLQKTQYKESWLRLWKKREYKGTWQQ